jgi:hypothetical protein
VTWAGSLAASQAAFIANGSMPYIADQRFPRPCRDDLPGVAISVDVGTLATPLHKTVLVAYDDVLSVDYFGQRFAGYASVSVKTTTTARLLPSSSAPTMPHRVCFNAFKRLDLGAAVPAQALDAYLLVDRRCDCGSSQRIRCDACKVDNARFGPF